MTWIEETLAKLSAQPVGGYALRAPSASEPTALAAIALARHGEQAAAHRAARWLLRTQASDGGVGINRDHQWPQWPTGLAVLAWSIVEQSAPSGASSNRLDDRYTAAIEHGVDWILSVKGQVQPRNPSVLGHDTRLVAWPWVEGTHSWIEPTAMHVLALKAVGAAEHPRTREAVAMLIDRQLSTGGCNYGNTTVLGQRLRPHVHPTGLALLALAGERDKRKCIAGSLDYLQRTVSAATTTASLCWALTALTAHGRRPAEANRWLQTAYERRIKSGPATHHLALLALAALEDSITHAA